MRRFFGFAFRQGVARACGMVALVLLGAVLAIPRAQAAVTYVQSDFSIPSTPTNTVSATFNGAQTAGNLIVVAVGWGDATASVTSITDTQGNTYTRAVGPTSGTWDAAQSIYYAKNIAAAALGTNTVTVAFSTAVDYPDLRVAEYSGIATGTALDVAVGAAAATGSTSNSGSITTTNANDLIVGANYVAAYTSGAGSGYTQRILDGDGNILEDRTVTSTGSYSATAPLTQSSAYVMQMAAFKAADATDTQAPTAPSGLTATAVLSTQINLSWTASTDNIGVTGYRVERCQGSGCSTFVQVGSSSGTTYSDPGLTASTSYTYRVRAADAVPNFGSYSSPVASATTSASNSIAYVQGNTAIPSSQSTVTATFSAAQTAGDLIVVAIGWADNASTVSSVTDTKGNTYTLAIGPTRGQWATTQSIYYAKNIVAAAAGANAVSVSLSSTVDYPDLRIAEYSGISTTGPFDGAVGAANNGLTSNSGALTTTNANDLLVGANYVASYSTGAGSGYTQRILNSDGDVLEDRVVVATGSYTASAPLSARDAWVMQLVAFKAAGAADTQAPTTPTGLTPTVVSNTQINLSWTASTDNVAVTGYEVQRCQGVSCTTFAAVGTPTGTTFNDTGLSAGTTYRYQVRARDAVPNWSATSSIVSATTTAPDTTAPSVPTGLSATAASSTQINLSWTASTDNVAVTGYEVQRCQGASCTTFAAVATPTGTSFNDTSVAPSTTYRYQVRARDAVPNWSGTSTIASATTPADTTAPSVPAGLSATVISSSQINLSWSASTDNVAVTGYEVQRCQGTSCTSFAAIATPSGTTFNDTGLAPGTTYRYQVRARDAVPNWSGTSSISSATTSADTTAPSVPTGLTASVISISQINLSWTASTDNVAVTGYEVQRCQGASCTSFAAIATPTGTTFNDTGLTANTTYRYQVRARDAIPNWSGPSSIASATTSADTTAPTVPTGLGATTISSSQINLSWTASSDNVGVTGYRVERCQGSGCSSFSQIATPTGTTLSDTGLSASTSYSYRVRAQDAVPNLSGYSNTASATTSPPPDTQAPTTPTGLFVVAASSNEIDLAWNASTDNVGVTAYAVERCQGPGCSSWSTVATPSATYFNDTSRSGSTSYSYRVSARDAASNTSTPSTSVTYVTPASGPDCN